MSAPPGVPLRRKPSGPSRATDWMERAACRGTTLDFVSEAPLEIAAAKRICRGCPVRFDCLAYAKARRLTGVFGGVQLVAGRQVTS